MNATLTQIQAKSGAALGDLLKKNRSQMYAAAFRVLRNRQDSEDVVQSVAEKAIRAMQSGKYVESGKVSGWLCRMARNLAIDHQRQKAGRQALDLEQSELENLLPSSDDPAEKEEEFAVMVTEAKKAIANLSDQQREVFLLRWREGLAFKEIAYETGRCLNTCLSQYQYALRNLRMAMKID